MTFQRIILGFFGLVFLSGHLRAEDAQAIVDATAKVYGKAQAYSAQVDSRTLQLVFAPAKTGEAPRYDVLGTQYRRLQLKVRRPNDYWLMAQSIREGMPQEAEMRAGAMGMSGMSVGVMNSWSLLVRADNMSPKRGYYQGGRLVFQDVPLEAFVSMVTSRMGGSTSDDPVLRHFQAKVSVSEGTMPLGLIEPELIGHEMRNGRPVCRIVAKTSSGSQVMLWIEPDTSLIVRSISQRAASGAARRMTVVETFYNYQGMSPVFTSSDFSASGAPAFDKLAPDQMGFGSVADLVKQGGLAMVSDENAVAGGGTPPASPTSPAAPAEDPAPTSTPETPAAQQSSAPVVGQALSQEQMSGIVLIEGDGGTATGFMTKIRDVDFIVTNLHVLEGNKKMKLKTLRGEEIPMLGVFGAVGSDIAIIRIGSGQGDLKLAKDVFGSSKIGDKIVVVGNRLGGGVATQTSGSIVGVGPTRIEVDANFESGNSGSPIVNLGTNEVIGVATYSETRRVQIDEGGSNGNGGGGSNGGGGRSRGNGGGSAPVPQVEKRWFGYRLDSVAKWESIDMAKWNAQGERIDKFRELSEALHAFIRLEFKKARLHPRLTTIIDNFDVKYRGTGGSGISAATEVKDLFRVIRSISDDGVKDLTSGDYYDYFRTSLYWQTSIPAQLDYRKDIIEVLKKYEANSSLYVSRMRGGS